VCVCWMLCVSNSNWFALVRDSSHLLYDQVTQPAFISTWPFFSGCLLSRLISMDGFSHFLFKLLKWIRSLIGALVP
jgi:hypothetical protein